MAKTVTFRPKEGKRELWEKAAKESGFSLGAWICQACEDRLHNEEVVKSLKGSGKTPIVRGSRLTKAEIEAALGVTDEDREAVARVLGPRKHAKNCRCLSCRPLDKAHKDVVE